MWFKNLTVFELLEGFNYNVETLNECLRQYRFEPCSSLMSRSMGWVPPKTIIDPSKAQKEEADYVYKQTDFYLFTLKIEEKLLPAAVVNESLNQKVDEIEVNENRKIKAREKSILKEEIYDDLLPKAFTKTSFIYAYIDAAQGLLVVDAASNKKTELITSMLRKALNSFKIRVPETVCIASMLTQWVSTNHYPQSFVIQDSCVIKDVEDQQNGTIRCQRQNLIAEEIASLVDGGRQVVQLSLIWRDQIAFVLTEDGVLKNVKFLESVQDQANDIYSETKLERFDADFSIMTMVLRNFLQELLQILAPATQGNVHQE
jgi:recombination associated protein RdgC